MALFISFPKFIRIFQKIRPYLFLKTSACFFNFVLPNRNFSRIFSPKHTGENPKTTGPIPVKICSIAILSLSSIAGKDRNEAVPPAGTQDGNRQDRQNPRSKIPGANCRFPAIPPNNRPPASWQPLLRHSQTHPQCLQPREPTGRRSAGSSPRHPADRQKPAQHNISVATNGSADYAATPT